MARKKPIKPIRFYREKFLIACYDSDDDLVMVCDNVQELADIFSRTYDDVASTISRIYKGYRDGFYVDGQKLYVHFIALTPAEQAKYNALNQKAYQT